MCIRVSRSVACILLITAFASADYVGVTTVNKDDPDTEFLCTQGNGDFVPGPLTVCNVFVAFDDPADRLLSVVNGDLQVYNGAKPDVFFQHPLNPAPYPPACLDIPDSPDLICDSFVAFGPKCYYDFWEFSIDRDFDPSEFAFNGHIVGGWHTQVPDNGQGDAGNYPDLQVLFLQSSVAQGLGLSGDIDIFWNDTGEVLGAFDVVVECAATCGSCPTDSDGDGDTDAADLAVLLGNWGPVDAGECLDSDTSGSINAFDLAVLLGNWGPCPEPKGCQGDEDCPDDGIFCNGPEECLEGSCEHMGINCPAVICGDTCNEEQQSCNSPAGTPCGDGDACTIDVCDGAGGCVIIPVGCGPTDGCCSPGCDAESDPDCPP